MLRFRLRTLFALLLIAALAVWLGLQWQRRNWATLTALEPDSSEAILFAHTVLTESLNGEHVATIHLRRRGCDDLYDSLEQRHRKLFPYVFIRSTNDLYHVVQLGADSSSDLNRAISLWQEEDQLQPGEMVINGVIIDRRGMPVGHCYLDLIGPESLNNQYCSREDGTFAMPMPKRVGNYFLRIRSMYGPLESRTPVFGINSQTTEKTVRIQVPFEAPPSPGGGGVF